MQSEDHLLLQQLDLPASGEWEIVPARWCFIRLHRGVVYCFQPGQAQELAPGDVLALPPGHPVSFRVSQLGAAQLYYFYFQPAQLNGLLTLSERQGFESLADGSKSAISRFPGSHPAARLFARLHKLSPSPNRLLERCRALEIIATLFNGTLMAAPRPNPAAGSAPARFLELIEKMPEIEILHQPPAELARRCGCSLRHFTRLFRSHFGLSVRARQIQLRLETARRLLRETNAGVVDIALDSGYHHLGLFNAVFKKRFGMTPTEFRRSNNGSREEDRPSAAWTPHPSRLAKETILSDPENESEKTGRPDPLVTNGSHLPLD